MWPANLNKKDRGRPRFLLKHKDPLQPNSTQAKFLSIMRSHPVKARLVQVTGRGCLLFPDGAPTSIHAA